MLRFRVIPSLLLKESSLVKSIGFKNYTYIGDPVNTIRIYNESEADEIIIFDIECSKKKREPDYSLLENIVSECFMPVTYGGGINNVAIAKRLFALGVEKVSLNHAALSNPDLLTEVVAIFGSQSVILTVDVFRSYWGKYSIYSHVKKKVIKNNLFDYIRQYQQIGFGELLINHVNLDGKMTGYDQNILSQVRAVCNQPVIALGGAGSFTDIQAAYQLGLAAASAGSLFVYQNTNRSVLINYPDEKQLNTILEN